MIIIDHYTTRRMLYAHDMVAKWVDMARLRAREPRPGVGPQSRVVYYSIPLH